MATPPFSIANCLFKKEIVKYIFLLKPIALFAALYAIQKLVSPNYANGQCAMRLVNETDPRAYSVHPYWKDLQYDESCAGQTMEYFDAQKTNNFEFVLGSYLQMGWNALSLVTIIYGLSYVKIPTVFNSVRNLLGHLIVGFFGGTLIMMHTHFEGDILYLTGAIAHHAFSNVPGIDKATASLAEGYLISGLFNRFLYVFGAAWFSKSDKKLSSFSPLCIAAILNISLYVAAETVGRNHPKYHEMVTPEMVNSWPYTQEWRAYKHCIVHHDNGESFSGDPFLDPVFDSLLYLFAYLHNTVFQLQLETLPHYIFVWLFNMLTGGVSLTVLYGIMRLCSLFMVHADPKPHKIHKSL